MQIFENCYIDNPEKASVLAFGNFDGVHTGHTHLLRLAREYAKQNNLRFGIYTFKNSPKFKDAHRSVITTLDMRLSAFEKLGADFVYLEDFDDVKDFEPDEFVDYIIGKFCCECAFCGDNFTYGKKASGKADTLFSSMLSKGKMCVVVEGLKVDAITVSSTRIKELIHLGNVEKAKELLGGPYIFTSNVVHGAHLGHTLGFPTVNQLVPKELVVPPFGVYSTIVYIDEKEYMGVTNFGVKPTVSDDASAPVAETYIIDFDGDVYGKNIGIGFYKKLRDEKKFSSLDELKMSISQNVAETKKYFEDMYEKN